MSTLKTLKPGKRGTRDLLTQYGESLLYVRYRRDEETGEGRKTVEIVVQRYSPARDEERSGSRRLGLQARGAGTRTVALRVGLPETELQRRVRSAGGRWDRDRRVWWVRRDVAERLDLLHRVVGRGS